MMPDWRDCLSKIAHQENSTRRMHTPTCPQDMQPFAATGVVVVLPTHFLLESYQEAHVLHKTLIVFAAAVAIGCVPMATTALAAHGHGGGSGHGGHGGGGGHAIAAHAGGGHVARYGGGYRGGYGGGYYGGGPIYDSCAGYGYGYGYGPGYGCPGYGLPLVGGVINGVLGGYGRY